jgi:very-short-patch-repair endonuclease
MTIPTRCKALTAWSMADNRRDRNEDALLQQHGHFVLRFPAEDAGKRLDDILDSVLATLVHRRK